jgi:hypothetical protein
MTSCSSITTTRPPLSASTGTPSHAATYWTFVLVAHHHGEAASLGKHGNAADRSTMQAFMLVHHHGEAADRARPSPREAGPRARPARGRRRPQHHSRSVPDSRRACLDCREPMLFIFGASDSKLIRYPEFEPSVSRDRLTGGVVRGRARTSRGIV